MAGQGASGLLSTWPEMRLSGKVVRPTTIITPMRLGNVHPDTTKPHGISGILMVPLRPGEREWEVTKTSRRHSGEWRVTSCQRVCHSLDYFWWVKSIDKNSVRVKVGHISNNHIYTEAMSTSIHFTRTTLAHSFPKMHCTVWSILECFLINLDWGISNAFIIIRNENYCCLFL